MREPIRIVRTSRQLPTTPPERHERRAPSVWLVRPSKLAWIPLIGALWLGYTTFGSPHLRFQYNWSGSPSSPTYNWCDYVGEHSRRFFPKDGDCPLIRFLREAE